MCATTQAATSRLDSVLALVRGELDQVRLEVRQIQHYLGGM